MSCKCSNQLSYAPISSEDGILHKPYNSAKEIQDNSNYS
mgnify:FL=1